MTTSAPRRPTRVLGRVEAAPTPLTDDVRARVTTAASVNLAAMSRPDYYGNPAGRTQDIAIVRAIYDAFNARDVEAALPYVAEDCELDLRGTAAKVGRAEPYRGHDGLREYFADVARTWDALTIHVTDFRVIPGTVIAMGYVDARLQGEPASRTAVWTWKVADGRATHVRVADTGPHAP
jgi:ketosteroid isomerase-like protein